MIDYFLPIGGANEIGASAYFLSLDGINILLDCGARLKGEELCPDYDRLLQEITDFSEIDLILISHAHYDHIGSFARISGLAPNAEIIATDDTKQLISMQLLDFGRISRRKESDRVKNERYRLAQALLSRIHVHPVMRQFGLKQNKIKITFMPAGHMPGAVMIYIETSNHRVLYSGDFSVRTMFGQNGMRLLADIEPDVFLLNAPNTYMSRTEWEKELSNASKYEIQSDHYLRLEKTIREAIQHRNIYLYSRSIPKHLDMMYFLRESFSEIPIVLEPKSRAIADKLTEMGYAVYGENIRASEELPKERCIIVGQEISRTGCVAVSFDGYSLHASPLETLELVKKVGAKKVFVLHVQPDVRKKSLADVLRETDEDIFAVQAENGIKYYLERKKQMKHERILQEVLQKERETANEQLKDGNGKLTMEWVAVYGSLLYPGKHPKEAYEQLQKTFVKEYLISYSDYVDVLRNVNLDSEERRNYVADLVGQGVTLLKKALDGDKNAIDKYAAFTEDLAPRDRKSRKIFFIGKYMVTFLILIDPDLKNDMYRPIVITFGARYCDRLLRNIRDRLLDEYGMSRRRRTARDVLQKTEKALLESTEAAVDFTAGDELERLRFANNNYKNSLELVQSRLDELKETIDETAADAKNAAVASFYATMNSDKYGNLLDSIELVERRLTVIKEQKIKILPQLMPLTIVFKQLLRFIRECGITPIDVTGREFTTEVEGLADYTYIGEAYSKEGEQKTVVVERPGWKFGDAVITLPTVREKEDEGSI